MYAEEMAGVGAATHPAEQESQHNFTARQYQPSLFTIDELPRRMPRVPARGTVLWAALASLARGDITTADFVSWRLAAYCWQLKTDFGWPIWADLVSPPPGVAASPKAKIARYGLDDEYRRLAVAVVGGE